MTDPLDLRAARVAHLAGDNPLRALTAVIDDVAGGINLGQGVCDLDAPGPLVAGALDSLRGADRQTYTHYQGLSGLREAIAEKLRRHNGLDVEPGGILVATGSAGAFASACLALVDPGDEVVLFEPFYPYHRSTLLLAGAVPVVVPLEGGSFALDPERFRAAVGPRTRAVVVNTPANPSGKVFGPEDLRAIAEVLAGTDAVVLTDEVYEYMTYDGRRHVSPATIEGLADRTLTIGSFSKTFSITGWRVGYLAGPPDVVAACGRVFDQIGICAPRPMQRGVEAALRRLPDDFYEDLRVGYEARRDRMCRALETAGFRFRWPQGSYYVLADHREVFGDVPSEQAVMTMIEAIGVNAVPGSVFVADPGSARDIRFHFAVEDDVLADVCQRLESLA